MVGAPTTPLIPYNDEEVYLFSDNPEIMQNYINPNI